MFFLSCAETTYHPRHKYAALAMNCELQAWTDAMDEDWFP